MWMLILQRLLLFFQYFIVCFFRCALLEKGTLYLFASNKYISIFCSQFSLFSLKYLDLKIEFLSNLRKF